MTSVWFSGDESLVAFYASSSRTPSDQIVEAVRANGVPVDYVLFEDEGHGFVKKENQAEAARRVLAFLDDHLRATS